MQRNKSLFVVSSVAALALILGACGGDDDGTGTGSPKAAGPCTPERIEGGTALGEPGGLDAAALIASKWVLAQAGSTVKIGFFGDLTGANSSLVIHSRKAAQMAIDEANAAGNLKVKIEFVPKDNKDANPDTAPSIEQGFIQDKSVVGVMGGAFSGETRAVGDLFDDAGLAHVSQSATGVDLTKQGWPFFRALPNDDVQGPQAGDLVSKVLECKKVAIIDDKSEYGAGLAKIVATSVEGGGGEVVAREGIEPTTDYTSLVDTLLAKSPDAVFYGGYDSEFSLIVKQAREKGLKSMLISGDGSKGDKLLQAGESAEGVVVVCPCLDPTASEDPKARKFTEDYKKKFNADPGIYAAEGYDVAQVLIAAIDASDEDGKVTRDEVLKALPDIEVQGITKPIKFTEDGEVEDKTIFAYIVRDGKFSLVGRISELGGAA